MDQERKKKRARSDQGDQEKKAKLSKIPSEQESCRGGNDNDDNSDAAATAAVAAAVVFDDVATGLGVFDFPWLKEGGGVSDECSKLEEDSFVSQLGDSGSVASITTITTPAGIEFSMPQVSWPFLEEKLHEKAEPLLRDFGFEAAESLDCIWSAFT